jgi:hypothetical protein
MAARSRRCFLRHCGAAAALGSLGVQQRLSLAAEIGEASLLAPLPSHTPPKAEQLILIFLTGGVSHIDTFDPKPRLRELHGRPVPSFGLRPDETRSLPLLGSKFEFERAGRSGLWISELFPSLRSVADELCVIRSMHTDIVEHFQGTLAMHTGSATVPMPSIGAWLSFGLGTCNPNLPSYVVLAEHLPYAGAQVWDASFLPAQHQGVRIVPGDRPIENLDPLPRPMRLRELEALMLRTVDAEHAALRGNDANLRARSQSFDVARGMMREAPEVLDLSDESGATLESYGVRRGDVRSFGWQCLVTRRLIERGVRVVELIDNGSHDNWDSHGDMETHRPKAKRVDRAITALLRDLRARGLLDQTLVAIATEFGRTPWSDGGNGKGRNHYANAFTCLLAGAGVRGGITYGATDELGADIVEKPCHVHDYHATILSLLGLDHERLTYRFGARDFRLTDVAGSVMREVLS